MNISIKYLNLLSSAACLNMVSLEQIFEEDPFGKAPALLPHQQS